MTATSLRSTISRSFLSGFLLAIAATPLVYAQQATQLPFDPLAMDQLTPEQKEKALQVLGQSSASAPSSNDTGRAVTNVVAPKNPGVDNAQNKGKIAVADDNPGALKPYGYELFASSPNSFTPNTDIPIPSDYVLGPGDVVRVQLFGNENGNYNLAVNRDGRINFPKLGPIDVAGQHFDDVRSLLQDRVSREMIGVQSSITLGELRSIRIFLLGEVAHPGSYTVSSLSTITNALLASGGIGDIGSLRRIELKREGKTVQTLDLYDLLMNGNSTHDSRLLPGDVIFVPEVGPRVSVDGEVSRPAIYELLGEKSIGQVLKLAGGTLASTNTSIAQIRRYDKHQKQLLLQLNLTSETAVASAVQDGDSVRVRALAGPLDNSVRVVGNVRYTGNFEWSPGLTLQKLLAIAQPLPSESLKETYMPIGLIERTIESSGIRDLTSFNVNQVISGKVDPIPLQRDDMVIILRRADIEFLDSSAVRAVAAGDLTVARQCPGLEQLGDVLSTERSIRFLKTLRAQGARTVGSDQLARVQADSVRSEKTVNNGQADRSQTQVARGDQATDSGETVHLQTEEIKGAPTGQGDRATRSLEADATRCPAIFTDAPRALPYLLEQSIAVYGEVRRPGIYPVASGTPLDQLIESAGGRSSDSDSHNIEYVSYVDARDRGESHYQTLDITKGIGSLIVNPGDILNFKPIYLGQEVGTVRADGEVRFPGIYGILKGEKLSQLIQRAGGLSNSAYAYGAIFTRDSARAAEAESYRRAAIDLQQALVTAITSGQFATLNNSQALSSPILGDLVKQLESAPAIGRIVIEADPTILETKPELDPILEAGDVLFMPKRPISVTIIGQVLNPGTVQFTPGLSVNDYLARAGGLTQAADSSRIFVILPNGTAQKFKSSFWNYEAHEIPPGSEIVVPRDATPFNGFAFSERLFQILSNLAITAASLAVISRN